MTLRRPAGLLKCRLRVTGVPAGRRDDDRHHLTTVPLTQRCRSQWTVVLRQCLAAVDRLLLGRPNDPGWAQSCRLWLGGVRGPRADQGEVGAYGVQEQGRCFGESEVPGLGELDQPVPTGTPQCRR